MTTADKIPEGSVTKPYTIMAILRLIDQGIMGFNDTIASHVDKILIESNGTTLFDLWHGDDRINEERPSKFAKKEEKQVKERKLREKQK